MYSTNPPTPFQDRQPELRLQVISHITSSNTLSVTIQHVRILLLLLINLQTDLHTHLAIYPLHYLLIQLLRFNHQSCCCSFFFMSVLEPGVSVPRKSSEESSFKLVVACGIIVCIVISPIVGLYFHHHRKSPKNGVNNYSCKTFLVHD